MGRINIRRVIVGGLVAGLIASLFDFVIATYLLSNEIAEMTTRLGINFALTATSATSFVVVDFVWGFLIVLTYACIRPRFGPSPKTALISGALPWLAIMLLEAQLTAMGIVSLEHFLKGGILYFLSAIVSGLAGAALYREDSH